MKQHQQEEQAADEKEIAKQNAFLIQKASYLESTSQYLETTESANGLRSQVSLKKYLTNACS